MVYLIMAFLFLINVGWAILLWPHPLMIFNAFAAGFIAVLTLYGSWDR